MTLILTLIRPGEGVWQTVDARVTTGGQLRDNFAPKQLAVHSWDGTVLLGYTGLAEVPPSGESMFNWIRTTLRGESRSIEDHLLHVRSRLDRDIANAADRRYRRIPLIIVAVGVLGTRPELNSPLQDRRMTCWVLSNQSWPDAPGDEPQTVDHFTLESTYGDGAVASAIGSGRKAVLSSAADMELLNRAVAQRPRKPEDYLGLLAGVNRRAAKGSKGTVSPWCSGTFMPEIGQELVAKAFSEHSDPEPPALPGIPSIVFGVDLTDVSSQLMNSMRNRKLGLPAPLDVDPKDSVRGRA